MNAPQRLTDIVFLGTFSAWNRGTLQARALPLATYLAQRSGYRVTILTTPWDRPEDAGQIDIQSSVQIINTTDTAPFMTPIAVGQQLAWIDRLHPKLIHVFKPKGFGGLTAQYVHERRQTIPIFVDHDDWEGDGGWNDAANYSIPQRLLFRWQERSLLQTAQQVTAASSLLVRHTAALREDHLNTVALLENGLSRDWIAQLATARRNSRPPGQCPTILVYSRFAEFPADWLSRFQSYLNEAKCKPVRLEVVGQADESFACSSAESLVSRINHGYVAKAALPAILGRADLAIYPYVDSLITRSKQSVKLLELMAAGCPIIASDTGDVRQVLGGAGTTMRTNDPEAFAQEALNLISAAGSLNEMGRIGMRRVSKQYSIDRIGEQLAIIYRRHGIFPR